MIQRIQSLYYLLAGMAQLGLFALPMATALPPAGTPGVFADGQYNLNDQIGLLVTAGITAGLALIAIFLFKSRSLQIRLGQTALLLGLLFLGAGLYFLFSGSTQIGGAAIQPGIGAVLPIIFLVFTFLGNKAVKKDEALVKSMDRLR